MLDTFTCHRYELNHLFIHLVLLQISFVLYDSGVYTTRRKQLLPLVHHIILSKKNTNGYGDTLSILK